MPPFPSGTPSIKVTKPSESSWTIDRTIETPKPNTQPRQTSHTHPRENSHYTPEKATTTRPQQNTQTKKPEKTPSHTNQTDNLNTRSRPTNQTHDPDKPAGHTKQRRGEFGALSPHAAQAMQLCAQGEKHTHVLLQRLFIPSPSENIKRRYWVQGSCATAGKSKKNIVQEKLRKGAKDGGCE